MALDGNQDSPIFVYKWLVHVLDHTESPVNALADFLVVFSDVKSNFLQLCYIFDMRSTISGS
jgi:hypothetical protein